MLSLCACTKLSACAVVRVNPELEMTSNLSYPTISLVWLHDLHPGFCSLCADRLHCKAACEGSGREEEGGVRVCRPDHDDSAEKMIRVIKKGSGEESGALSYLRGSQQPAHNQVSSDELVTPSSRNPVLIADMVTASSHR